MDYERFASLVAPHTQSMARAAAALIGLADAEDAAQEALVRAWTGWEALREERAVRAWLLRITVNVCHNWQSGHFGTHRSRTLPLIADEEGGAAGPLVSLGPGTTEHTAALDVRLSIRLLPAQLRDIVALRFYAGMDASEIGISLDIPASTVRTRLRRALILLRNGLVSEQDHKVPSVESPLLSTTEQGGDKRR